MWELGHKANPKKPTSLHVLFLAQDLGTEGRAEVCSFYMWFLFPIWCRAKILNSVLKTCSWKTVLNLMET